jgi:hypothetical protein
MVAIGAERGPAGRERHRGGNDEHRHHRPVGHRRGIPHRLAEIAPEIVIAADALAADEGLRRGLHPMLGLEGIGLLPRLQQAVIDLEAPAPQQVARLEAIGTGVPRHHHPVQDRFFRSRKCRYVCHSCLISIPRLGMVDIYPAGV